MSVLEGALTVVSAVRVGIQRIPLTCPAPGRGCTSPLLMQHLCAKAFVEHFFIPWKGLHFLCSVPAQL